MSVSSGYDHGVMKRGKFEEHVIEFRSGTYFQSIEADNGGPKSSAQHFPSWAAALKFMREHNWIQFNGGMPVPVISDE